MPEEHEREETTAEENEFLSPVQDALAERERNVRDEMRKVFLEAAKPVERNRVQVTKPGGIDPPDEKRPANELNVRLATHPLYRSIPEDMAPYRSQESDHFVQMWIMGLVKKRSEWVLTANEAFDRIYGRAPDWTVGTPDTGGGASGGTAGEFMPVPLLSVVEINRDKVAKIPRLSTNFQLTSHQSRIPTVGSAVVGMVAEGSVQTAAEPTAGQLLPRANKMQGHAVVTVEALADSAFNLVNLLGSRMGAAMGALEDVQACTSDGTAPSITAPIDGDYTRVVQGITAPTYGEIAALYFAVAQQYRGDAVWYGNTAALTFLTGLESSGGFPIFSQQSNVPGAITDDSADGVMFRKPVYEVPLVGVTTTNGDSVLAFMSRSVYGWARRSGIEVRTSEHASWSSDAWNFKFTQRVDGLGLDAGGTNGDSGTFLEDF